MRLSAGILPYRLPFEVLIAHPGGPFWERKDAGVWSVIKGEVDDGEGLLDAAKREFAEETGWPAPEGAYVDLGEVRLRSRKLVRAWAVRADFEPSALEPGLFTMSWRGRVRQFPEIDRVVWAKPKEAARLLNPAQVAFVERLAQRLGSDRGEGVE